jgi:very-short-patch-repair endonuclease
MQTGIQRVDFYIPEHNLCVEVDGSTHYYGLSQHPLAKTELKYRLMRYAGLKVLRIEHFNIAEMIEE